MTQKTGFGWVNLEGERDHRGNNIEKQKGDFGREHQGSFGTRVIFLTPGEFFGDRRGFFFWIS